MSGGPMQAPPRAPGERFHCRVDVEDICLSVEGTAQSSTTALFWEEARVACRFNGITQRTRWIALQPAMDEVKRELQAAAASGGEAPQTGGLLALPYAAFNNLSYEVEFTADDASEAPTVTTVKPKRIHLMELVVEAQNLHRVYSASGGQTGDRAPTSGNMEVISATLNKKAAKVSAWTRSIFSKLGSSAEKKEETTQAHQQLHHHQSAKEQNESAMAALSDHTPATPSSTPAVGDLTVHEGSYETVAKHIDVSEAYNRPGGRQYYCLVVKPESRKLPDSGVGTPITISFSVVAHYGHTESVPRSFHNFAIVIDQFVLDYSEAARVLAPDPKDDTEQARPITGYAFGYTANTSVNPYAMEAASKVVPVVAAADNGDADAIRVIDFDRLHREVDERKRTPEDYKAVPSSCCVVSGSTGARPANAPRLGNRVVCVSRFKTSPDGLCKPSFKCQFVLSLVRFHGEKDGCVREAAAPINLAALLNEEILPQRIRAVKFELGEVLYMRLRRFSFAEPEVLRAPLLLPYDYDNSSVVLPAQAPARAQQTPAPAAAAATAAPDRAVEAAPPARTNTTQREAPTAALPAAAPPSGLPDISFASSSSSSSVVAAAVAAPQGQRSGSDSGASTPRAHVQRDPTAPFFTLEPQQEAAEAPSAASVDFGASDDARVTAYDPMVAAATAWGGHTPAREDRHTTSTVEVTPSASNPFFSTFQNENSSNRVSSQHMPSAAPAPVAAAAPAQRNVNPFSFEAQEDEGEAGENGYQQRSAAAFELTPFE